MEGKSIFWKESSKPFFIRKKPVFAKQKPFFWATCTFLCERKGQIKINNNFLLSFTDSMKSIMWLREIKKEDIPFVGGKGANLGEMVNEAFPVPQGFVVTAQAYFKFIEEKGIKTEIIRKIDSIDVEKTDELEKVSKEIRELILKTPMNKMLENEIKDSYSKMGERKVAFISTREEEFVAVRSSATAEDLPEASFAGQQETFLNIKGRIEVLEAVKRCWASLFTARAVYYRKRQNFETEKVGIAVVVQKMVDSEIAGILFTAEPTGDTSKIIIEAGYGLGEAVVSGSITPDTYTIEKGTFKIIEKKISKQEWSIERAGNGNEKRDVPKTKQMKQKLEDKFIVQLAKIGRQIENHYNKPMDIEWALYNKQLYIVQARPITTLGMKEKTDKEKDRMIKTKEKPIAKGQPASPGIVVGKAVIIPEVKDAFKVKKGDIIVTKMTTPDWVPIMEKAKAIITEEGGKTCHAAIVSRELGIPCIVGVENAMKKIEEGETITVDGFGGVIYEGEVQLEKPEGTEEKVFEDKKEIEEIKEELEEEGEKFGKERDGKLMEHLEELMEERAIKVKVNVALPEAAEKAAQTNADGVGLLRAEHMITESGIHPAEFLREGKEEELIKAVREGIRKVAVLFKDKPVWYRTFDARSDEFRNLKGGEKEPKEDNPMIGWHGIRRSLDEPKLIQAEFKAIKDLVEEGFDNIGVMLPFVISAEEVKKAKELALEVGLKPRKDVKFGVMIETPASVWVIDELIEEGMDFISFGTNDLTQLTLGIDRNNERIQKNFSELHPAILRSCEYVIKKCNKAKVITSICGQAASNEEMVEKLISFGIKSVSANIDAVENIKRHVLILEKRELLEKMKK